MAISEQGNEYHPRPIDTADITIPTFLSGLSEALAANAHDVWAAQRLHDGWRYGKTRDDAAKLHPCLVPYDKLPDEEKKYDRNLVNETICSIIALGYKITPAERHSIEED